MISERLLSLAVQTMNRHYLNMKPWRESRLPAPNKNKVYMLYAHVPFCVSLCPYCSFNRFPFEEGRARAYFRSLRREIRMLAESGYDFESMYIGGGTPTILPDELAETITLAKELFSIRSVSTETNPNHLNPHYLDPLRGLVDRMSVGVQSFDDGLLRRMCRYEKYGSGADILERLRACGEEGIFKTLNADMIFNYPTQTEDMLLYDLEQIKASGCNQVTFYPLMVSPAVKHTLTSALGVVDYAREERLYSIICRELTEGADAMFRFGSAWTFNRAEAALIDEYVVDYEEYAAVGSGGMSFLNRTCLVNTFSLDRYAEQIEGGRMSASGHVKFNKRDHMRYRLMMQLFGLRLDKRQWAQDFGCTVAAGLPAEYLFLKAAGAFDRDDDEAITLSSKGRYLLVAMMRQFFIGVNSLRDEARKEAGIDLPQMISNERIGRGKI